MLKSASWHASGILPPLSHAVFCLDMRLRFHDAHHKLTLFTLLVAEHCEGRH
ncbi:hypothetical protein M378DRAFT_163492 [Amanita muscaria Koide BX008]|uniref:Uncharacterized protein n=1 Tax=Amanita muscaria (strain Koide BX008) TaxID=946122 RepID=A0A0C2WRE5_AMAMK|nr:hypothetical protein M378DRAFT_163492 [Amanita muscaria Koide BX008]